MPRLFFYVAIAFVTSFAAVSWAARGFPMHWSGPVSVSSLQPTIASTFGDTSAMDDERKRRESAAQKDTNPSLDKIRHEVLQATTGFEMSPCNSAMKKNLIEALTAYTRAWQTRLDCPVKMFCTDEKLKAAATAFSTPLDKRIKEALFQAFMQPGIVKTDFPASVQFDVLQFAGPGLWAGPTLMAGAGPSVCGSQTGATARDVR
ncbi:hypothetical protein CQ12_39035 [Bradyrhizobium jicamae]|uniref:Uncharacterized protein n=1 Tax=Bradyrhizobium jicamae TaxID=280332 RepID=A0A0R3LWR6_9BRAD|nr:hypothetical protein [Bradyrhizobium jicamae]KRR12487.1 hypothetical protein CQ12_39035 [Bradyrhizobium jicamae]